jgi:hypothetical protein
MARSFKVGMDYFPCDVNFTDSFKVLEELHGNDGLAWMIKFWQAAYKTKDGVIDLRGARGALMAKQNRITPEKQREIIKHAVELELIQEKAPEYYTSDEIQETVSRVEFEREKGRIRAKNSYSANNKGYSPNNVDSSPKKCHSSQR